MMPPVGLSRAERWVADGIRASALDLILRLTKSPLDFEFFVLTPEEQDLHLVKQQGVKTMRSSREKFHFGEALGNFCQECEKDHIAYFGAGSAPLLESEILLESIQHVQDAENATVIVNNFHSTDWAIFNRCGRVPALSERLPSDNQIGWVLANEADYQVEALSPSAATRSDIDTPVDLLLLSQHSSVGPHLKKFFEKNPVVAGMQRVKDVQTILKKPASTLSIIGRSSSHMWQELERRTQIWIRVFVEERGMLASGRQNRGEVRSLLGEVIESWGYDVFIGVLSSMSDAVLWDTRVWMAHLGIWPSAADRFASDLGWETEIEDPALQALTRAVLHAQIPIVIGGHGVVSGGLYALLESMD